MNPFRETDPLVQSARAYSQQLCEELKLYEVTPPEALNATATWDDIFTAVSRLINGLTIDRLMSIAPFIYERYADIAGRPRPVAPEVLKTVVSSSEPLEVLRADLLRVNAETARQYLLVRAVEHERSRLSSLITLVALAAISGLSSMILRSFGHFDSWITMAQSSAGLFAGLALSLYLAGVVGGWIQQQPPSSPSKKTRAWDLLFWLLPPLALLGITYRVAQPALPGTAPLSVGPTLTMAALVGLLGSTFSVLQRLQRPTGGVEPLRALYAFRSAWSQIPLSLISGIIAAMVLYAIFAGKMVEGALFPKIVNHLSPDGVTRALPLTDFMAYTGPQTYTEHGKLLVWAFIAGFAERLVPDILDRFTASTKK